MKKQLLVLIMIAFCLNTFSQIEFEEGYFINDSNKRVDCLIKNTDWQFNPSEFKYKLSETSEIQTASIRLVKEFGIKQASKYVRAKVNIDRSSQDINKLTSKRNPTFQEEILFLKLLVEGKASLFIYEERGFKRFFYQTGDSKISQLIYKSFLVENKHIGHNNQFRQQLRNDVNCQNNTLNEITELNYTKNELVGFFVNYNECQNSDYVNYDAKDKKGLVNLSIRPGFNNSSLVVYDAVLDEKYIDFGNLVRIRLGVEFELLMPFNKNKWAVVIEPTYQNYKSQKEFKNQSFTIDYWSIEMPVGFRHYFYFNKSSKVFINASFIWDISTNSTMKLGSWATYEISAFNNYAIGLGYKYSDSYSIEMKYHTNKNLLEKYYYWYTEYETISIILGYSF